MSNTVYAFKCLNVDKQTGEYLSLSGYLCFPNLEQVNSFFSFLKNGFSNDKLFFYETAQPINITIDLYEKVNKNKQYFVKNINDYLIS